MGSPTDIAGKVFEIFTSLDSKQKCLIEVVNHTGSTLKRMSDEHSSGGFATLPESEIPAGGADAFVSHDTGFLRGAVGQVTYGVFPAGSASPQGTWTIHWSIPEVGDSTASADLQGLDPATFVSRARIGAGNETEAKFELEGPGGGGGKPGTPDAGLKSTVLIEVRNNTDVPLVLLDQGHDHGGFVTQPALEIPAGGTDSFASFETDRAAPGSKGFLKYQAGDDCEWTIGWDNPENADNTSESSLDGAGAGAFRALDQIGAGEENVPATFTILRRSGGGGIDPPETGTENSVEILVVNQSSDTLLLLDSGSFTGRFQTELSQEIQPGESFPFVSAETEDRTTGCSGFVRYFVGSPDGCVWTLMWDNPEEGENTSSATLEGPNADSFSTDNQISQDKPAAAAMFTIIGGGSTQEPVFEPPAEADEPTLRLGDQSVDGWVEYLQTRLTALGFGPLTIDGNFDNATLQAVRAFQLQRKLLVDGVVGNQTWAALREEDPRPPSTDGREPHTYVEAGPEARFFTEDSSITFFPGEDLLILSAVNTGDETLNPGQFEATARITFPSGEQHTFTVPLVNNQTPAEPGALFSFEGSIGRPLDPGTYLVEAYLPAELGGDQTSDNITVP
ncbi:peptidoglycan-binding domain-containing protein [Actinophytocola sp.]|uniref:peptidoglycan-binding domain-containing protein n=1 Tax=Actinophytocola sp. TaxID=1872138 RepID=UPI002D7E2780|nr:peptidoglycan-binding domain-containing protein [Actinophytocola sp.]HET9144236.1 peptidoglycan-binding domain-containing protein [Actinophytocola sp.]